MKEYTNLKWILSITVLLLVTISAFSQNDLMTEVSEPIINTKSSKSTEVIKFAKKDMTLKKLRYIRFGNLPKLIENGVKGKNLFQTNLSILVNGMYFVEIKTESLTEAKKIILTK